MPASFWDSEFQVSDADQGTRQTTLQTVAVLPDGRTVVVWAADLAEGDGGTGGDGNTAIRACILNPDGTPAGADVLVNTTTAGGQGGAAVAVLTDGRFVVTWTSHENGDGGAITGDNCVRARVFNADGSAAVYNGSSADFVVNTLPGQDEYNAEVVALTNGGFVIGYGGPAVETAFAAHDVQARVFTATGPAGNSFVANDTDSHELFSSITALSGGGFVMSWVDAFPHNSFPNGAGYNVVARVFSANGAPVGPSFLLATTPTTQTSSSALGQPHVAALADGGFAAAWTFPIPGDGGDGTSTSIRGRVFNADGTPRAVNGSTADFQINTTANFDQRLANIAGLADGRFLVSFWSRDAGDGNASDTLLARLYNADGTPDGANFVLNQGPGLSFGATEGSPSDLVQTADGRILAIYSNEGANIVLGRYLELATAAVGLNGSGSANRLFGTRFNDTLNGGSGDDSLYGGDGNDTLTGGNGTDLLSGGGGNDTYVNPNGDNITEGAGGGIDTVNSDTTTTLGDNLERLILSGTAAANGTGNALANQLSGNSGNNLLTGLDGADTLTGGAGNDTLDGGNAGDTLRGGVGNDTYVNPTGDSVEELADQGTDTVQSDASYTLGAHVERLFLTGGAAIDGTGNSLANIIQGNAGNNALYGLDGDDTLQGGNGNDTLSGGNGLDSLSGGSGSDTYIDPGADIIVESAGGGTDSVQTGASYSLANENLERLFLTGTDDIGGSGNSAANLIQGNAGANTLSGLAGADTLQGGAGNDSLDGGDGADLLVGGPGRDRLTPGPDAASDTLRFAAAADSTGVNRDLVIGLDLARDKIDLPAVPVTIAGLVSGGVLNEAGFNANLASAIGASVLAANGAVLFDPSSGTADYADTLYLIVDANGVAGYQANADYVLQLQGASGTLDTSDFV
ncbi:MAG: calcium-binding protein [Alphaproteobacteria bacterium]|nr:calcium-binding protein [Alphaproteobacteria bacterium]